MSAAWDDIRACAEAVVEMAKDSGQTISVAESCTGGGIGAAITDVSGASAVFPGGVIAYANAAKKSLLGVPEKVIIENGAVSAEVAIAMAEGVLAVFQSDISVAVTGIAGPAGGTEAKPVGLVYIATAQAGKDAKVEEFQFGDIGRAQVRQNSIFEALVMLGKIAG